jgi:hypothetical protein
LKFLNVIFINARKLFLCLYFHQGSFENLKIYSNIFERASREPLGEIPFEINNGENTEKGIKGGDLYRNPWVE